MQGKTCKRVVVQGKGIFPIDMLRYDACFPDSEADSITIMAAETGAVAGSQRVTLRKVGNQPWTPERWLSFGWSIVQFLE